MNDVSYFSLINVLLQDYYGTTLPPIKQSPYAFAYQDGTAI